MSKKPRSKPEVPMSGRIWKVPVWLAVAAVFGFVVVSLVSYNGADAPGHVTWPQNDTPANWGGPVGAATAYTLLRLLGWAVLIPIVFAAAALVQTGWKRRLDHPLLRFFGVVLVSAGIAGLFAVLRPQGGLLPGLPGGTLGLLIAETLMIPRFGSVGSVLWLGLVGLIGMVVAADRLMFALPRLIWRGLVPAAATTRTVAAAATEATREGSRGVFARFIARLKRRRTKVEEVRLNDIDDPIEVAVTPRSKRRVTVVPVPRRIEAEPLDEMEDDDDEAVAQNDDDAEDDDLPGAPQVFDREKLKEKIAALNVRFSGSEKSSATDEDLEDIQNAIELEGYRFPGLDLLEEPEEGFNDTLESLVREQAESLESALQQYRINGEVVDIESGPVITLFHVRLAPGTKVAQLNTISSDLARSLRAVNIRIVSNIEGRDTVGIEVPNPNKEKVRLKELMSNRDLFASMKLPMFLGKDAAGDPLITDLTKMPHMLIAGTTGSGKSVCMNTIIMSFLYTKKPNELKLVLVDPKMVEMSQFRDIPHLMCPVVTEMHKAAAILEWACQKMDERYELLAEAGCRDITAYNNLEWEELKERFNPRSEQEEAKIPRKLPYMVFIIDELADLMMTNKEVESSIIRIAQKARAVGIHLILATQRPQANVVTGLIKSNMPCRITFKVASNLDSRVVLDQRGGELLLGQGDMLYLSPQSHKVMRAQGTLVDDLEIRRVVKFMKSIAAPSFERQLVQLRSAAEGSDEDRILQSQNNSSASLAAAQEDPMFDRAVEIVLETKRGSVSLLQRRLAIGYTRASRLIDLMGIAGIIGDHKGSVAREVMITPEEWVEIKRMAGELAAVQGGQLFPTQDSAEHPDGGDEHPESGDIDDEDDDFARTSRQDSASDEG
ncbi:MAG: DNA translocase FtsK 4TM domain-containing protein [Phycisphaeraceae bacterium]|nr:DNA translocase FtsK 4TM domain-containing protein [Phycisphaeraceae bacterium]MCW5762419.1 DNA translocase FtsK 4TM domain-containing protein [Phycisphaeraceae bacterium]